MTYKNSPNDIVIIQAIRTPFLRAKNTLCDDTLITQLLSHVKVTQIEEVILGNVLISQGGVVEARSALLKNNIDVPVMTINKQCCSSLEAVKMASERVGSGCIVAGGYEIMSNWGLRTGFNLENDSSECNKNEGSVSYWQQAKDCGLSMGETSEILAERFGISRDDIDEYACETYTRAFNAMTNNKFKEIKSVTFSGQKYNSDNGIRMPNLEKLKALKPVFRKDGVSTAGNSSQLSDGAALVVVCKRKYANDNNLKVICRYVGSTTALCEPAIMGYAPVNAINTLLKQNNVNMNEIKYYELNEAFGSQALCCLRELKIPRERYNVFGGSIAIGHPVGATGARLVGTLASVFEDKKERGYGIVALCAASGIGMASLLYFE